MRRNLHIGNKRAVSDTPGGRLAQERKRLQLTQEDLAKIGGVSRRAQVNYEGGVSPPDANYLGRIAPHGVDVLFVVTGARRDRPESLDEELLRVCFSLLDEAATDLALTYDIERLSWAVAHVYKLACSADTIEERTRIAFRESRNAAAMLAASKHEIGASSSVKTGSKAIDDLIADVVRFRVQDQRDFVNQMRTLDAQLASRIEDDLGDPLAWPGHLRGKLIRELIREELLEIRGGGRLRVSNEGRCAAYLSVELDRLQGYLNINAKVARRPDAPRRRVARKRA